MTDIDSYIISSNLPRSLSAEEQAQRVREAQGGKFRLLAEAGETWKNPDNGITLTPLEGWGRKDRRSRQVQLRRI